MNEPYIAVIIALIAGPTVAIITARMSRPKVQADAAKTYTDIGLSLVQPQKDRIKDLEATMVECQLRIGALEVENRQLRAWAQHLVGQVVELGGDPVPFDSLS